MLELKDYGQMRKIGKLFMANANFRVTMHDRHYKIPSPQQGNSMTNRPKKGKLHLTLFDFHEILYFTFVLQETPKNQISALSD